jgi:thiopeptide-type bacteriocin biosynthesis protein
MRKPPGLRLRFELEDTRDGAAAAEEIEALFGDLADQGLVDRWYPSVYEAEVFKFGGPEAIDAVHAYFFADSSAWWRWDEQQGTGDTSLNPRLLSVSVLNDLFAAFTDGPEEVWDVWCHIAVLHGDSVTLNTPAAPKVLIDDLVDRVSNREAALLRGYASSNAELVRAFRALHAAGKLLVANRLVLPHIALAHWNRYGFTPDDRASMYTRMIRAWSPYE